MHLLKVSYLDVDVRMHSDFKYSLSFPLSVVVSGETLDLKAPFFLDLIDGGFWRKATSLYLDKTLWIHYTTSAVRNN